MTIDTKVLLAKQKSILLTKLASLACSGRSGEEAVSYRNEANAIVREFMLADRALASIAVLKTAEFTNSERPIDAILAYLDKVGSPASEGEIIDGIVCGGFRLGNPKARLIVLKSIGNHLHGTGARSQLIKSINGLIGRWEWKENRFNK